MSDSEETQVDDKIITTWRALSDWLLLLTTTGLLEYKYKSDPR